MSPLLILIIILVVLLVIIFLVLESDRTLYISHLFYDYYFKFFPIQPLNGLHNTLYRSYTPNIMYPVSRFPVHRTLIQKQEKVITEITNFGYHGLVNMSTLAHKDMEGLPRKNYHYLKLYFYGYREPNLDQFPILSDILRKHPEIQTMFLSIMKGRQTVPYHRGSYNGVLRYHFPITKSTDSYMEILGTRLEAHHPFVFDDTYPHKLEKTSPDTTRIVLIIDIDNPYSPFILPHHYIDYAKAKTKNS